jgi:CubicO group peptidase (beta-lactamase class C family)
MKRLSLFLLMGMIVFPSCSSTETAQIIDDSAKKRIDSTLKTFVDSGRVAGTSALIFEDGEEVYFNAFGDADQNDGTQMDRNTIVQIFSMTKPITGVALMQQFEQGKFELDDPLADYLPEFSNMQVFEGFDEAGDPILVEPKRALTIRDITRHTAGFANDNNAPYVGELLAEASPLDAGNTLAEFAEKLGSIPLTFHPGDQWYYGPSVDVQAYLVEKLSGQPFDEYIREHILDPLGMNETRYVVPEQDWSRMSSTYQKNESGDLNQIPDEQMHAFNRQEQALTPGGWGLTSTLDDYMTFAQMLVHEGSLNGHQILKPETVELMATNHLADDVTERLWLPSKGQVGFGIDFAVRTKEPQSADENVGTVGEFFWDGAATTLFWVDPANELTAVFFVQVFPFDGSLHKDFRDAVYGPYEAK